MRKILLILIILLAIGTAQATWYDTNYTYFKPITINHSYVNGTVTNHTLLIDITDTDLRDKTQADGDDIIFVNYEHTTQLDHQIEKFNSTTGHLIAWIRVSSITNTSDTTINMYYNYSGATNSENPSGVWGTNAAGVWLMNEGTGTWANDSSSNTNNGSLENMADPPTATSGWNDSCRIDGGLQFDGANDYVDCGIIGNFKTVTMWVKLNTHVDYDFYFAHNNFRFYTHTDNGILYLGDSSANNVISSIDMDNYAGQWVHIAGVSDGADSAIYFNGINVVSTPDTLEAVVPNTVNIGRWTGDTHYTNGAIDSVRIYNRALSAEEIRYHYNRGGPVAEWNFDEGSGQTAYDESFNNNDGTLGATSAVEASDPTWVEGKYGGALSFDGGDYVDLGYGKFDYEVLTVCVWFKATDAISSGDWRIVQSGSENTNKWMLSLDSAGVTFSNTDASHATALASPVAANKWYHVCGVRSPAESIYLNGVLHTTTYNDSWTFGANTQIGTAGGSRYFNGSIDDVRIYNYARTPEQILQDYNAGKGVYFK